MQILRPGRFGTLGAWGWVRGHKRPGQLMPAVLISLQKKTYLSTLIANIQ